jgi:hypothetical protein
VLVVFPVSFDEAPGGTARAFKAVGMAIEAARIGESDYTSHLAKASKKNKV